VEFLCTVDSIIAHGVLIASIPFHPVRLISFNRCILVALLAIKETLLRSDRVERDREARTQCEMVLSAVRKNSIVHSTIPVHILVQ